MEYLSDQHFTHLNTADDISGWTTADIKVFLPLGAKYELRDDGVKIYVRVLILINDTASKRP